MSETQDLRNDCSDVEAQIPLQKNSSKNNEPIKKQVVVTTRTGSDGNKVIFIVLFLLIAILFCLLTVFIKLYMQEKGRANSILLKNNTTTSHKNVTKDNSWNNVTNSMLLRNNATTSNKNATKDSSWNDVTNKSSWHSICNTPECVQISSRKYLRERL